MCEAIAEGDAVTPALRKEALSQASHFLAADGRAILAKLTGSTPAKLAALAARVAKPPAGAADTAKLMAEILALAEAAADYLTSMGADEAEGGEALTTGKAAVKATKAPAKAAGGLKANSKPKAAKAAAAAAKPKAKAAKKPLDVEAMVKELVKEATADFESGAVAELVKAVSAQKQPKKAAKPAAKAAAKPAAKPVAAAKAAKVAKVRVLCACVQRALHARAPSSLTPHTLHTRPALAGQEGRGGQEEVKGISLLGFKIPFFGVWFVLEAPAARVFVRAARA